jgi:hypothetical protein
MWWTGGPYNKTVEVSKAKQIRCSSNHKEREILLSKATGVQSTYQIHFNNYTQMLLICQQYIIYIEFKDLHPKK